MKASTYHNLTWIPILIISLSAIVLGLMWMMSKEPWMLDRAANEELLHRTFDQLFSKRVNDYLPDYLTAIYRFFGWWVFSIGSLSAAFVLVTRMGTPMARKAIQGSLGIMLAGAIIYILVYIHISPFLWLAFILLFLLMISGWAGLKLEDIEE